MLDLEGSYCGEMKIGTVSQEFTLYFKQSGKLSSTATVTSVIGLSGRHRLQFCVVKMKWGFYE